MNLVAISGTLGKEVELKRQADSEFTMLNNTIKVLANNNPEKYDWINIIAYNDIADHIFTNFKKGDNVYIQGKLKTHSWEDENEERRFLTQVLVYQIERGI